MMSDQEEQFFSEPIPRASCFALDAGYVGRRAHIIHGLLEIDVTKARSIIREHRESKTVNYCTRSGRSAALLIVGSYRARSQPRSDNDQIPHPVLL